MKNAFIYVLFIVPHVLFSEGSIAIITSISGDVTLYRAQDTIMHHATTLDNLFDGDSLQVIYGEATLLFNTGRLVTLKNNSSLGITAETVGPEPEVPAEEEPATPEEEPVSPATSQLSTWVIISPVVGVVLLGVFVFLLIKRRRHA